MGWFSGATSFVSGLFKGAGSISGFKPFIIIVGVLLVLLGAACTSSYILMQRIDTKNAELETRASEIKLLKTDCETQKYELISKVKQLEVEAIEKSVKYTEANIRQNVAVAEALKAEKEKNKLIIEQAKREQSFKAVWRRINTLLN